MLENLDFGQKPHIVPYKPLVIRNRMGLQWRVKRILRSIEFGVMATFLGIGFAVTIIALGLTWIIFR